MLLKEKILKVCSIILGEEKKKAWRKDITRPLQVIPPKNAIMQTAYSKFLRH